jgi:hypothetical protein
MLLRNVSHCCRSLKSNEVSLDDAGGGVDCGSSSSGYFYVRNILREHLDRAG